MSDTKTDLTRAAQTLKTHDEDGKLSSDLKDFLMANRAQVMKFFSDAMSPDTNAAWRKAVEPFDLSDEFKTNAAIMFEHAVEAKVERIIEAFAEDFETLEQGHARLIGEPQQLLDYIERECPLDEDELNELSKGLLGRYIGKASANAQQKSAESTSSTLSAKQTDQIERKVGNRNKGISRAVTRLTTESDDALNEAHMARYVDAIRRTSGLY